MIGSVTSIPGPFEDGIVHEPRRIEEAVVGLNEEPLRKILESFEQLIAGEPPRIGKRLPQALFLTSAQAGYGKSHLIGRLFRNLARRATLIYVRPFLDADGCWQSILLQTIQEMDYPDRTEVEFCTPGEPRQIEAFAHGVLTHLTADLVASGKIIYPDVDAAVGFLRGYAGGAVPQGDNGGQWMGQWAGWMKGNFAQIRPLMVEQLNIRNVRLSSSSTSSWLNVLLYLAFGDSDPVTKAACFDWLCGRSLDDEYAVRLGVNAADCPRADALIPAREELCRQRIFDLSKLAGFYRPFLVCFDQTENYGRTDALGTCLAVTIQELVDCCQNILVLFTANLDSWQNRLARYFEGGPYLDRIRFPALQLEGITRDQARQLVSLRLEGWPPNAGPGSLRDGSLIEKLYANHAQIGIRAVLGAFRNEWDHRPVKTLDVVHEEYAAKLELQHSKLVYDPEFFKWLVRDVAARLDGVNVVAPGNASGYFPVRWKLRNGEIILFGFEPGAHGNRWCAIMRELTRMPSSSIRAFFFRTPEQVKIPRQTWGCCEEFVKEVKRGRLAMAGLTVKFLAELYACRSMFLDAVQGDLDAAWNGKSADAESVLEYVAEKLQDWRERWNLPHPAPGESGFSDEGFPVELAAEIRLIAGRARFLSLQDLMGNLNSRWTELQVQKAIGSIPELRAITNSSSTVLVWKASVSR